MKGETDFLQILEDLGTGITMVIHIRQARLRRMTATAMVTEGMAVGILDPSILEPAAVALEVAAMETPGEEQTILMMETEVPQMAVMVVMATVEAAEEMGMEITITRTSPQVLPMVPWYRL
jgi:hypothetical protein